MRIVQFQCDNLPIQQLQSHTCRELFEILFNKKKEFSQRAREKAPVVELQRNSICFCSPEKRTEEKDGKKKKNRNWKIVCVQVWVFREFGREFLLFFFSLFSVFRLFRSHFEFLKSSCLCFRTQLPCERHWSEKNCVTREEQTKLNDDDDNVDSHQSSSSSSSSDSLIFIRDETFSSLLGEQWNETNASLLERAARKRLANR